MTRQERLEAIIKAADGATMRTVAGRKRLAERLAGELHLWEPPLHDFVRDMAGLNFFIPEDRQTFILFFIHAYAL